MTTDGVLVCKKVLEAVDEQTSTTAPASPTGQTAGSARRERRASTGDT
jgi:hypothetical protein